MAVRGAAAGIGLLVAVIAGVAILIVLTVFGFLAYVGILFQPTRVEVASFADVQCQVVGDEVHVHATVARGPEYDDSFDLGIQDWQPQGGAFESSLPDDDPSVKIGDSVTLIAPVRNAAQITGVNMYVWRGEPGYTQTVPLTIDVTGTECTAR